jgi:hypothetical protein
MCKKNLFFSLENNNTINTYIHPNDRELVRSKPISPLPIYNVTFSKFDEIDSSNQKIIILQMVGAVIC